MSLKFSALGQIGDLKIRVNEEGNIFLHRSSTRSFSGGHNHMVLGLKELEYIRASVLESLGKFRKLNTKEKSK